MSHTIEIIGLGAGDINQLPLGIYKKLTGTSSVIYTRTNDHPVIDTLQGEGIQFTSFDETYEAETQFAAVYETIVEQLVKEAKNKPVIYTVPGHPMLAEKTVQLLLEQTDIEVTVIGGKSYLDDLFTALKIDPIEGFQFVDATSFTRTQLDYRHHVIFCQVYDRFTASEVKLALLEDLPADYNITIAEAVGSASEEIKTIPLEELDRSMAISNLTSVYVPPAADALLHHTFARLRDIIAILRGPDGCPWDQVQTHESLRGHVIEEVYELIEAIDDKDDAGIIEELGDLLLQVMLHSQIGEDAGYFVIDDVIRSLTDKMIHRHPHVFADKQVDSVADVNKNWEQLKQDEKGAQRRWTLDGVPKGLPALARAFKIQKKAAKVGFDWDTVTEVWDKLDEEIKEVNQAIADEDHMAIEKELGDVLFVLANLARYYKVNPEIALNQTNQKFTSRFSFIEQRFAGKGKAIYQASRQEMDDDWEQAKRRE